MHIAAGSLIGGLAGLTVTNSEEGGVGGTYHDVDDDSGASFPR